MIIALGIGLTVLLMIAYNYTQNLYYEIKRYANPKLRPLCKNFVGNVIGNFLIAGIAVACIVHTLSFIFSSNY